MGSLSDVPNLSLTFLNARVNTSHMYRLSSHVKLDKDDEVNAFRNRMQIKVKGDRPPKPIPTFYDMDMEKDLKNVIVGNIEKSDWKEPTPIQMQGIPSMLAGRDVLAAAPTGSGKTAAL
jgi:ATP-dependent RNA helicase DDX41